jgi:hypothetical protein
MLKRYSRPGAALASASLALATLFLLAAGDAGFAAPAKGKAARQAPVERTAPAEAAADKQASEPKAAFTVLQGKPTEPAATGAVGKDGEESCFTARRKLWVDGEGWIVRRVTTCR